MWRLVALVALAAYVAVGRHEGLDRARQGNAAPRLDSYEMGLRMDGMG
jgi:hypothetical protein